MKLISRPGGGVDTSLYANDGTLSANRTVDSDSKTLSFINSNIDIDANVSLPSVSDADGDTQYFVEESADEDRHRWRVPSTFLTGGDYSLGHADEDGLEFRSWRETTAQVLLAGDDVDTTSSFTFRAEALIKRDALPDSVPVDGIIPGYTNAADTGSWSLFQTGRDIRVAGIGVLNKDTASGGTQITGMWSKNFSNYHFTGFGVGGASMWVRSRNTSGDECYIRMDPTRFLMFDNATGTGSSTGSIWAKDFFSFPGGGHSWRDAWAAEMLRAGVGTTTYANQVFDATVRGMSFAAPGTVTGPGPGATDSSSAWGMSTSSQSTPAAQNLVPGIPLCTAFDLQGGAGTNKGWSRTDIFMELSFETVGVPVAESVYVMEWWENSWNLLASANRKEVSFGPNNTRAHISMYLEFPGDFLGIGPGPLGYPQLEFRIYRISGSDDIQVINQGARVVFKRVH